MIEITYTITCDVCGEKYENAGTSGEPFYDGWFSIGPPSDKKHLCSKCADQILEEAVKRKQNERADQKQSGED